MTGSHKTKTVRGVNGMTSTEMQTAQALQPKSVLGDRFIFEDERLFDKVACRYYVPEQWLVERVNAKLELEWVNAKLERAAACIRALKESL